MTQIGTTSLNGILHEEFHYPFLLTAGIVVADEGKAVAMTTTANTVNLATDGDAILGRLERVEDRSVEGILIGTVALFGGMLFLLNPDATASSPDELPAVGDYIEGAVSDGAVKGFVQRSATATKWQVVQVNTTVSVVVIGI